MRSPTWRSSGITRLAWHEERARQLEGAATLARRDGLIGLEAQIVAYGLAAELRHHQREWILYSVRMAALCCGLSDTKADEALRELTVTGVVERRWGYGTLTYRRAPGRLRKRVRRDALQVLPYAKLVQLIDPAGFMSDDHTTGTSRVLAGSPVNSPNNTEESKNSRKSNGTSASGDGETLGDDAVSDCDWAYTLQSGQEETSGEVGIWPHLDVFRQGFAGSLGRVGWWVLCEIVAGKSTTAELAQVVPYSPSTISRVMTKMQKRGVIRMDGQRYRRVTAVDFDLRVCDAAMTQLGRQSAERGVWKQWCYALAEAGKSNRWIAGLVAREFRDPSDLCEECGQPGQEVHHIVPRFLGGADTPDNLAVLCRPCHQRISEVWRCWAAWPLRRGTPMVNFAELVGALSGEGQVAGTLERFEHRAKQNPKQALDIVRQLSQVAASEGVDLLIAPLLTLIAAQIPERPAVEVAAAEASNPAPSCGIEGAGLARHRRRQQRAHRSGQPSHRARQGCRQRLPPIRQLPAPAAPRRRRMARAARREAQEAQSTLDGVERDRTAGASVGRLGKLLRRPGPSRANRRSWQSSRPGWHRVTH